MSEAIVSYDFIDTFPLWIWVSSWATDDSYPAGFRYKLFSTRSAQEECEFVLVLEERNGEKSEMKRLSGPSAAVRRTALVLVKGLGETYGIEFDEFDFSDVKTAEEFERRVEEFEWPSKSI
ncbi:MAG TPA: hypothetical protein VK210_02255 [Terriglobia bacterium]|nr:hypothetical protein [Terriglobia bacterium]